MEYLDFKNSISEKFNRFVGIVLTEEQCHNFYDYMELLILKNKVMNLTAITEPEEIILRHFVDSVMAFKLIEDKVNKKQVVDIGTGAGFPGLPLAIVYPDVEFVLTDTLGKRINFLQEVLDKTLIKNVKLYKTRVEDFANDKMFRERFDYVVSRGVAKLSVLAEYSLPLIKVGGKMIALKMNGCDEELNDAKSSLSILGGMFHVKHSYDLIDDEPKRCVIEIEKIKNTPKIYPRKAGTPSKNPLK